MSNRILLLSFVSLFLLGVTIPNPATADFSKAKFQGKPFCPKGAFYDPRKGGECWSCPSGTHRTVLHPVNGDKACEKRASSSWSKAAYRGKAKRSKPKGAFYDPRKGGEWWKCPSKRPRRTAYAVTHKRACATKRILGEKFARATFLGKVRMPKPKGAFYDPRKGGEYWSCPAAYKRTAFPVTAKNACRKGRPATLTKANYKGTFGCAKGTFFDPRKGGQCWSCPVSYKHRTVNPVTSSRACASNFGQVFAADSSGMCRKVVAAIRDGSRGAEKFQKEFEKFTAQVTKPLKKTMSKVVPDINSPKALQKVIRQINATTERYQPVLQELVRVANLVQRQPNRLSDVLLNPNLVCSGNPGKINDALHKAGLNRNLNIKKASLLDGFLISSAHAKSKTTRRVFHVISVGSDVVTSQLVGPTLSLSVVTDFHQNFHLYFSLGVVVATAAGYDLSVGYMIFPHTSITEFASFNQLGLELGFSSIKKYEDFAAKKKFKCLIDRIDGLGRRFKNCAWPKDVGVAISFDPPVFKDFVGNVPGIGLTWSKTLKEGSRNLLGAVDVSFSGDGSWKLLGN